MLRAEGAHEKEHMAHAMHKLTVVVHEVVSPVGFLEAETAPVASESEIFHGCMEVQKTEPDGQRSDRSEQSEVNGSFLSGWGSKKWCF